MYGIFLVEDESIIRETLRDTIPWNQYGYAFLGEASDGEMALTQIRQLKPDVVLTDIRMPFMDGLDLSRMIRQEFPWMKIIIISGYDDFEYARQALNIGVEQYLLKPVTKHTLIQVLAQVKEKIDQDRAQQNYKTKFLREGQQYEEFARKHFLEQIVEGQMSLQQIYEKAGKLDLDLRAQCYNLAFFSILPKADKIGDHYSEPGSRIRDALLEHFLKYPQYLLIRWNLTTYAVLMMTASDKMSPCMQQCINVIRDQYGTNAPDQPWFVAVSTPTPRLSMLKQCFEELSQLWAYRLILPREHILTRETIGPYMEVEAGSAVRQLDAEKLSPSVLRRVLEQASLEEVENFSREYLHSIEPGLAMNPFCQYLMFTILFTAVDFAKEYGVTQASFEDGLDEIDLIGKRVSRKELSDFCTQVLSKAIRVRDQAANTHGHAILNAAVSYIDQHFQAEEMSLNRVAQEVNISANYLSAIFSQEMGRTFVEYVTGKRMERARELLKNTEMRSGEVAAAVGYRDPHYFSFLFKKTQGCTPRDYRNESRK